MLIERCVPLIIFSLVSIMIFANTVSGSEQLLEGPVTAINCKDEAIKIRENWYNLKGNTKIIRNGIPSTLKACQPLGQGFYQWAAATLNNQGEVIKIKVDYSVLEGIILEISQGCIELKVFKSHPEDLATVTLYFTPEALKELDGFKEGEHLIVLAAGNRVYKLVN